MKLRAPLQLSKAQWSIVGTAFAFLLALATVTTQLVWYTYREAVDEGKDRLDQFMTSTTAAVNRNLLTIDVLLAGLDELLDLPKTQRDWFNVADANRWLRTMTQQQLLLRQVALLDIDDHVMASSEPEGVTPHMPLPSDFRQALLQQAGSALLISTPVRSPTFAEPSLYLGRRLRFADGSPLLAVAELPITALSPILTQGVDIAELQITLENTDGLLLASVPPQEALLGRLMEPLRPDSTSKPATGIASRIDGAASILVARPTLYRQLVLSAALPLSVVRDSWRPQRVIILVVAGLFAITIVLAMLATLRFWEHMAQARRVIAQSKNELDQALDAMVTGVMLLDAQDRVVRWNRRYEEIVHWVKSELRVGTTFAALAERTAAVDRTLTSDELRTQWVQNRMATHRAVGSVIIKSPLDSAVIEVTERRTSEGGSVIVYHDVTKLHEAAQAIEQLAFYDPLTHLPNRRLLMDRLHQALAGCARHGCWGAALFLDLDNFKTLNDTLGHDIGDQLLMQVAQRLQACTRDSDTVARLGGDEFVIMLSELPGDAAEAADQARRIGTKVLEQVNQQYQLSGLTYRISVSIGATLFGRDTQSPAELLKQADIAMYQVKARGRNDLCFFDPQMQAAISARVVLEHDIREALQQQQFVLHYQSQVDDAGTVVGAEVLLRWQHPQRGMVSPAEFIPIAEESGLIVELGSWVLQQACAQLAAWRATPHAHLNLSVNLSARQFHQHDFVAQVARILDQTGVPARHLKLELTESLVLDNIEETIRKMQELQQMGVAFSVDDFGTGQSSLTYLTRLPLDQLKIDQSFVRNIGVHHSDGVIVQTIIGMARNLGLQVIAEGVETEAQQTFLAAHGCRYFQGYRFGRPMPLTDFVARLVAPTVPESHSP